MRFIAGKPAMAAPLLGSLHQDGSELASLLGKCAHKPVKTWWHLTRSMADMDMVVAAEAKHPRRWLYPLDYSN